jgi:sulfate transport system ATP-binding protein
VRSELRAWLRELHDATHLTTLLVTHDQEEALELSDRIVVMDKGRIHQVGSPRDVYDDPKTPFVASFVGTANVLKGEVKQGRASVGAMSVAVPSDVPDGANVRAIVRPHDVRVAKMETEPSANRAVGRVERLARLGAYVKLDLRVPSGETVTVHMPRKELEDMGLNVGDPVLIDLENARVFTEDFAI